MSCDMKYSIGDYWLALHNILEATTPTFIAMTLFFWESAGGTILSFRIDSGFSLKYAFHVKLSLFRVIF